MQETNEEKASVIVQDGRRNLNRRDIQEWLKNVSIPNQITHNEKRKGSDKEIDIKYNIRLDIQVLAYVTNVDSISVVDILKGREITKIPLELIPLDIVISPDEKYAYVTYPDDAVLGVISISKNKEIARVSLNKPPFTSNFPLGAAVSPDGKFIYVANYGSLNVSIVKHGRNGWRVIGEIPLGKRAERIAITPNGRLAYVTLRDDSEIAVIDLLVNLPIETIPAEIRPIDIAINKSYVGIAANAGSNSVTVFNAKLAKSALINIPVGDRPPGVAFNKTGNLAYVTNINSNTVSVINMFQHTVITDIPVGRAPIGIAVTEDGKFTVVANSVDNTLSIIDNSIEEVIYTVPVGIEPFFVKTVTLSNVSC